MRIKTLTWNIGGGKLLASDIDPELLASYTVDGIDSIIKLLKTEQPDIITLQETQANAVNDQARMIAGELGYSYVHDLTSNSHIDTDHQLGHAILTRHKIVGHSYGFFTNPNAKITWEDGSTATSFDKGYTTCTIKINDTEVAVTTLHLIPFKRFAIDIQSNAAKTILANVQETIADDHTPWIIQGDFNIDDDSMRNYLPMLFDDNTTEVTLGQPTTPSNRKYDHIIIRGGTIQSSKVLSDVLTDHYPVIAEVEI